MNEKEMGQKLLRGEGSIDPQILTDRVLQRDRRRMWLLGGACVVAWMLVVMLPWATVLPMMAKVAEHQMELNRRGATASATAPVAGAASTADQKEQAEQSMAMFGIVKEGTIATFIGSVASMFVAAVCTVSLILLSRRATLRQMNDRLAEISARLKSLAGETT